MKHPFFILMSLLALLTACRPEVPEPVLPGPQDWVKETDTVHFKLLWQQPIAQAPAGSELYLTWTPQGIVYGQGYASPSPLVCRNAADGSILWTGGKSYQGRDQTQYVNGYIVSSDPYYSSQYSYPAASAWYQSACVDAKTGVFQWEYKRPAGVTEASRLAVQGGFLYQIMAAYADSATSTMTIRRTLPGELRWDTVSLFTLNYNANDIRFLSSPVFCPLPDTDDTLMTFTLTHYQKGSWDYYKTDIGAASLKSGILHWYTPNLSAAGLLFGPKPLYNGDRLLTYGTNTVYWLNLPDGKLIDDYLLSDPNDNFTSGGFVSLGNWWSCITRHGTVMSGPKASTLIFNDQFKINNIHNVSSWLYYFNYYLLFYAADPGYIGVYYDGNRQTYFLTSPNTPRYPSARIVSDPVIRNDTLFCSDGYFLMCYKLKL